MIFWKYNAKRYNQVSTSLRTRVYLYLHRHSFCLVIRLVPSSHENPHNTSSTCKTNNITSFWKKKKRKEKEKEKEEKRVWNLREEKVLAVTAVSLLSLSPFGASNEVTVIRDTSRRKRGNADETFRPRVTVQGKGEGVLLPPLFCPAIEKRSKRGVLSRSSRGIKVSAR